MVLFASPCSCTRISRISVIFALAVLFKFNVALVYAEQEIEGKKREKERKKDMLQSTSML